MDAPNKADESEAGERNQSEAVRKLSAAMDAANDAANLKSAKGNMPDTVAKAELISCLMGSDMDAATAAILLQAVKRLRGDAASSPTAATSPALAAPAEPPPVLGPDELRTVRVMVDEAWYSAQRETLWADLPPTESMRPSTLSYLEGYGATAIDAEMLAEALGCENFAGKTNPSFGRLVVHDAVIGSKWKSGGERRMGVSGLLDAGNAVVYVAGPGGAPSLKSAATFSVRLENAIGLLALTGSRMRENGKGLAVPDGTPFEEWLGHSGLKVGYLRQRALLGWAKHAWGFIWAPPVGLVDRLLSEESAQADQEEAERRREQETRYGSRLLTEDDLDDLRAICNRTFKANLEVDDGSPATFDAVPGLAPHTRARLAGVAARIGASTNNPPGVLLVGPPGNGKTMLARILANGSGRHFVHSSIAEWQGAGTGHLGDMLGAMQSAFREAKENAPSLLFLDELDSAGHRQSDGSSNAHYWNIVINALLEQTSGIAGRGDVVLVGATNHQFLIDPALLRAGRFGETVEIPDPDRRGRKEILDFYLGEAKAGLDVNDLADRVGPCNSASLRDLALRATEIASLRGVPADASHIEEVMAEMMGKILGGRDLARLAPSIAIGLCAKAYVACMAYGSEVAIDGFSMLPGLADLGRVSLSHRSGRLPNETAADLLKRLHVELAPAAGRLACGEAAERRGLAAGDRFADLPHGDMEAARSSARILARTGAAGGMPGPGKEDAVLQVAWRQVLAMVQNSTGPIAAAAMHLVRHGRMSGQEFQQVLYSPAPKAAPTLKRRAGPHH